MSKLIRMLLLIAVTGGMPVAPALAANSDGADNERWRAVRDSLFAGRTISEDTAGVIELDTPVRAADAAVVPIAIRTQLAQTPSRYIKKVWLVIDRNPSPVGAVFTFTPDSGRADIETRVRVEEYTHVRAVAETSDGKLYMTTRFVKASGGCSAPAGSDAAAALAAMGKMAFRVDGDVRGTQPVLAQLTISHPNHSGLAMDQYTRQFTPAHYVRKIDVTHGGKPVFSADVDFSMSENPSFRFYFLPQGNTELRANVVDSSERRFEGKLAQPAP